MEGPRCPSQTEYSQVLEFLHHQLRPESTWQLNQEYPTALGPNNLHNIRIITEKSRVLSHAVIKPLIIRSPLMNLKVAAIGSVVTDSQFRGQGLSTKVLQACLKETEKQDCDIAVLWTNLYDFYRKLDFELAGTEMSCSFEQEFSTPLLSELKVLKSAQVSPEALYRLYSHHTVGSVRTTEEIRKNLQIPNSNVYTAWDKTGQLVAYAIEGKGADLQNYIHEWGGHVSKLIALLSHIRKDKQQAITLIFPRHSLNLQKELKNISGAVLTEGFLGMIKIMNEAKLFTRTKKAAHSLGVQDLVLERKGNVVLVGVPGDLIEITDPKDVVSLLFSPVSEIPHLNQATTEKLRKIFPIPLWFWGWDSV